MSPPPVVTIRAATFGDAAAIMQLHRESILALGTGHYSTAELESWAAGLVAERYVAAALSGQPFYEAHGYRVTEARTWQTRGGLAIDVVAMTKAVDSL